MAFASYHLITRLTPHLSPLMQAVHGCDIVKLEELIAAGESVNEKDGGDCSLLHVAARLGWHDGVKLLIERGADASVRDKDQLLPIQSAIKHNNAGTAMLLVNVTEDLEVTLKTAIDHGMVRLAQIIRSTQVERALLDSNSYSSIEKPSGRPRF